MDLIQTSILFRQERAETTSFAFWYSFTDERLLPCRFLAILAALVFTVFPGQAATVTRTGTTGANGANGSINPPVSSNGKPGLPGGGATAVASSSDAENTAVAIGGRGGAGGKGAHATSDFFVGGHGGDGGFGAPAIATATTTRSAGTATATATARGGSGNGGGEGGSANMFPGEPYDPLHPEWYYGVGGNGGHGGDAGSSSATATASTTAGRATATATAGGDLGGLGGGGGHGGDGDYVPALGLGVGGNAGAASTSIASALASNTSADPVTVTAVSTGGSGGVGSEYAVTSLLGGFASAGRPAFLETVAGSSTGGGPVSVKGSATGGKGGHGNHGGDGGSVSVVNAVGGSTSGKLSLTQEAVGGDGGNGSDLIYTLDAVVLVGDAGSGGNANSQLDVNGSLASKILCGVTAYGGRGGQYVGSKGRSGNGGTATAGLRVSGAGDIDAGVVANGGISGEGELGGSDGGATLEPSIAISTGWGKSVKLTAEQIVGEGTSVDSGPECIVTDAVSGSAPGGKLTLRQRAFGGNGNTSSILVLPGGNIGGGTLLAITEAGLLGDVGERKAKAVCDLRNVGPVSAYAHTLAYDLHGRASSIATASATCLEPFGSAFASASDQIGSSGTFNASAEAFGGSIARVGVAATATLTDPNRPVEVKCSLGSSGNDQEAGTSARADATPLTLSNLVLPTRSATALEGMKRIVVLGFGGGAPNSAATTNITLNTSGFTGNVKLALLSSSVTDPNHAVSSVHFRVARGDASLVNESFTDWTALSTYFTDHVLDLGGVDQFSSQALAVTFTITGGDLTSYIYPRMVLAAAESPVAAWAGSFGITGPDALPDADPDQDGLPNRLEYAFGLNPGNGSSLDLPQGEMSDGSYVITFGQPTGVTGITYAAECSSSLEPNTWLPVSDTGTGGTHIFSVPIADSERCFVRLVVLGP